ncbi:uncharacterized protein L969DRAFT_558263 [Mixia osmundae IAM 14324]|uniref:Pentacotripeptide-repeat region of PRORP domain-containing protein n=1 Tax=Mixia osmundae (strain CBS 9802 / IAM 14324 / JCM 22182 / KY 12970) TaxID=764103 RepID=G7DSG6_MIXOS|nr:uncharacterized protein L969DRAFT_558263 [Mixia osmundae IAM 14324]KEI37979.1 hypothetical protein L969DRAFT_558263 [Mixia osmundae IAM 14324]GAA93526.1 hypothetical protein E5Q_00167 [Mixia osmundae IAM 14324]
MLTSAPLAIRSAAASFAAFSTALPRSLTAQREAVAAKLGITRALSTCSLRSDIDDDGRFMSRSPARVGTRTSLHVRERRMASLYSHYGFVRQGKGKSRLDVESQRLASSAASRTEPYLGELAPSQISRTWVRYGNLAPTHSCRPIAEAVTTALSDNGDASLDRLGPLMLLGAVLATELSIGHQIQLDLDASRALVDAIASILDKHDPEALLGARQDVQLSLLHLSTLRPDLTSHPAYSSLLDAVFCASAAVSRKLIIGPLVLFARLLAHWQDAFSLLDSNSRALQLVAAHLDYFEPALHQQAHPSLFERQSAHVLEDISAGDIIAASEPEAQRYLARAILLSVRHDQTALDAAFNSISDVVPSAIESDPNDIDTAAAAPLQPDSVPDERANEQARDIPASNVSPFGSIPAIEESLPLTQVRSSAARGRVTAYGRLLTQLSAFPIAFALVALQQGRMETWVLQLTLDIALCHAIANEQSESAYEMARQQDLIPLSRPTFIAYLRYYSGRADVERFESVWQDFVQSNHRPDVIAYTLYVSLYARRRDPVAAAQVIETMRKGGIRPDRFVWTALMDAHIAANNLKEADNVFNIMRRSTDEAAQPDATSYNCLLKGYVAMAVPYGVVSKHFYAMLDAGLPLNEFTYLHLLTSACDAGYVQEAIRVFNTMSVPRDPRMRSIRPNGYHYSMLINCLLRANRLDLAQDYLARMRADGVLPTRAQKAIFVSYFSREMTPEGLEAASQLTQQIAKTDALNARPYSGRNEARDWHVLVTPQLKTMGQLGKTEAAEELYRFVQRAGVEPSLQIATAMLDVYRRAGNLDATLAFWPEVIDTAVRSFPEVRSDSLAPRVADAQRSDVCICLSIIIRALGQAGEMQTLVEICLNYRDLGFGLDPSNFNDLCVALSLAGWHVRAFFVAEELLSVAGTRAAKLFTSERKKQRSLAISDRRAARYDMRRQRAMALTPDKPDNDALTAGAALDDFDADLAVDRPSRLSKREGALSQDKSASTYALQEGHIGLKDFTADFRTMASLSERRDAREWRLFDYSRILLTQSLEAIDEDTFQLILRTCPTVLADLSKRSPDEANP